MDVDEKVEVVGEKKCERLRGLLSPTSRMPSTSLESYM